MWRRYRERGNIEAQFFNIQARLKVGGRRMYVPPEGKLIRDIESSWTLLEKAEHDRELAQREELVRFVIWSRAADRTAIEHTHTFNGPLSRTTRVSRHHKGKTNLDFTEARDSEWQWHQLGHMQVCTSLQTDNHASTPPLSF